MIAKEAMKRIKELKQDGKDVIVFCYGKKAAAGLNRYGFDEIKETYYYFDEVDFSDKTYQYSGEEKQLLIEGLLLVVNL